MAVQRIAAPLDAPLVTFRATLLEAITPHAMTTTKTKANHTDTPVAHTPEVEALLAHTPKEPPETVPVDTTETAPVDTTEEVTEESEDKVVLTGTPLEGQELLNLVKSCGETVPRDELIRLAGYTKVDKNGTTRLMYAMFMEALLEAQGTKLGTKPTVAPGERGKMGHPPSFIARIHFNGNLMVGKTYVHMLDAHERGKEFQIVINPESNPGGINLVPVPETDEIPV